MNRCHSTLRSRSRLRPRLESLETRTMLASDLLVDFGGTSTDEAWDVEVDAAGDVYVTGRFSETVDFDPDHSHVADIDIVMSQGSTDIFAGQVRSQRATDLDPANGRRGRR